MRAYNLYVLKSVLEKIKKDERTYVCFNTRSRFAKRIEIGQRVILSHPSHPEDCLIVLVKEKDLVVKPTPDRPEQTSYPYVYISFEKL